jgi:hypothetical protein
MTQEWLTCGGWNHKFRIGIKLDVTFRSDRLNLAQVEERLAHDRF